MSWTAPRMWEGGTAIIIGGGPSILKQFNIPPEIVKGVFSKKLFPSAYSSYLKAIHNQHIIAVNVAYRIGPWIDVMFFGDTSTWNEEKKNLTTFRGLKVSCAGGLENEPSIKWMKREPRRKVGISTDPNFLAWNRNSGSAAINLAVHFGVKRIILLGFDMKLDTSKNQHWHKIYDSDPKSVDRTMAKHLAGFPQMKSDLDRLHIEVLNANPDSKIDAFRKLNFKDIRL